MAQYQSFPGVSGDSRSLEKLEALRLPSLRDKRFLDVGCNEGFFCGYALWDGAARSVGIDHNAAVVMKAQQRFPAGEFYHRNWKNLPDGPFDVILLASSLHYADDQPALVDDLTARLSSEGLLVLEMGIHPSLKNEWVLVKRGIDERTFPTRRALAETLREYAWKFMSRSVTQEGDPIPRFVVHVMRRKPMAYLLMQPPAFGKSSIARSLFEAARVRVVGADRLIAQIAMGKLSADPALECAIRENFSQMHIDEAILRICDAGLIKHYVERILQQAGKGDFALDAYIPATYHAEVIRVLTEKGYMPVQLAWEQVGSPLTPALEVKRRAQAYYASLARSGPGA